MNANNHQFKVGAFDCWVVSDGSFAYPHPVQTLFVNAPPDALAQTLKTHNLDPTQWETYVSPYAGLVINTGQARILIDTGAGDFAPTTGKLLPNLRAIGFRPDEIDLVILTHAHADHIGGNLDEAGRPAFPNAKYVMLQTEWDYWTSAPDLSALKVPDHLKQVLLTFVEKSLVPLADQIELISDGTEIVPGIEAIAAPGHTPGHMAVSITSNGQHFLNLVDTVVHPIHLEQPGWCIATDTDIDQTIATRRRLFERAIATDALVYAFHFPAPSLGYIVPQGAAWRWQPTADKTFN